MYCRQRTHRVFVILFGIQNIHTFACFIYVPMRKLFIVLFIFSVSVFNLSAQNTWLKQAAFGGGLRNYASGFSIGNTGYIFCGTDTGAYFDDVWAWNSSTNVWREMALFTGGERIGTSGVSLNGFGYVLGGEYISLCFLHKSIARGAVCGGTFYNDIWRYNPDSNVWDELAAFPGSGRDFAVAVADPDDSTIYYGTGNDVGSSFLSDWWAYSIPGNTWKQLSDFPGGQRVNATGFIVNGKIYVGSGNDGDTVYAASNDFWEYTPSTDTWTRIADIPGIPINSASAFSIGNYGYVCLGANNKAYTSGGWQYDPGSDTWTAIANYSGGAMANGVAFTIGSNGYIGTGSSDSNATSSQFWQYSTGVLGVAPTIHSTGCSLYPNPASHLVTVNFSGISQLPATLNFIDVLGNTVGSYPIRNSIGQTTVDVSGFSSGIYFYQVSSPGKILNSGKFIIAR